MTASIVGKDEGWQATLANKKRDKQAPSRKQQARREWQRGSQARAHTRDSERVARRRRRSNRRRGRGAAKALGSCCCLLLFLLFLFSLPHLRRCVWMELVVGALSRAVAAVSSVLPITQPTQPDSLESSSTGSGTSSSSTTSLLAWWQQQPPPASSRRVNTDWREAFLKGVAWSPDGTCILAGAADNNVRLFEL